MIRGFEFWKQGPGGRCIGSVLSQTRAKSKTNSSHTVPFSGSLDAVKFPLLVISTRASQMLMRTVFDSNRVCSIPRRSQDPEGKPFMIYMVLDGSP